MTATSPLVRLRRLREDDRWTLFEWRGTDRVRLVSVHDEPLERERHSAWFDTRVTARRDEVLVVEWQQRPVGVVQLEGLDADQGLASWGCHLGDTDVPHGLGASLPLLVMGYGFESHGLRRMQAQVLGHNHRMLTILRRIDMAEEGVLRRHLLRGDGTEADVHLFGVLRDEWPALRDRGLAVCPPSLATAVSDTFGAPVTD
jgi:RimJ/RimL family protein N-acetyltransferase